MSALLCYFHSVREIPVVIFVKILEAVFLIGVAGCAVTIPMAAWGYFSVLFEKDTDAERDGEEDDVANRAAD